MSRSTYFRWKGVLDGFLPDWRRLSQSPQAFVAAWMRETHQSERHAWRVLGQARAVLAYEDGS